MALFMKRRLGLSYMEVLIAAAIGLAGILGAVAMFPVAVLNMQKGVVVDMMAAAGPSALEQAKTVKANKQSNWLIHDVFSGAGTGFWTVPGRTSLGSTLNPPLAGSPLPTHDLGPWMSLCIDTRFAAEMAPAIPNATGNPHLFPYVPRAVTSEADIHEARMLRVSLKRNPNEAAAIAMSVPQSRLFVKISDDLIFDRPGDITIPAAQNYILADHDNDAATPGIYQRRNYMAEYEFMITLAPRLNGVPVDANNEAFPNNQSTPITPESLPQTGMPDTYTMSAVIFHKRLARLNAITTTAAGDPAAERVVSVSAFYSGGAQGGDVRITTQPGQIEDDLVMHEGDWVLLSKNSYNVQGTYLGPLFQWYRVTGLSTVESTGSSWYRDVTLEGNDWPSAGTPTQMTIVTGVVGVFETTVTRED